jgi:hypothetical protein
MFENYRIDLTLTRDMLGTNPCDPNVMDTHIIERQRKMILEKGGVNSAINKYLDAIPIGQDRSEDEVNKLLDKAEAVMGITLTGEERAKAIAGELNSLKETFEQLDLKGTTVFFWDKETDRPCISDHMILGFLKAAAEAVGRTLETKKGVVLHSISYTQSLINQHVRPKERFLVFDRDIKRRADGTPDYLQRSLRVMTAQGPRVTLAKSEVVPAGAKLSFTLRVLANSDIDRKTLQHLFDYGQLSGLGQWRNASWGQFAYELTPVTADGRPI